MFKLYIIGVLWWANPAGTFVTEQDCVSKGESIVSHVRAIFPKKPYVGYICISAAKQVNV